MGVGVGSAPCPVPSGYNFHPRKRKHEQRSVSGWRKVERGGGPAPRAEGEEEKKEGGGSRGKGRKKKRAAEEKDPPLPASSWAGHLQGLSLTAALGCWRGSQEPSSPRVQLCAAQRRGPRLAPRAFPSRALLLQPARARAHIHTLALRACAVGGAAPGRLLPPRVGSASAGRRAVSERGASQRAREPERPRERGSAPSSEQRSARPALPGHRRRHHFTSSAQPPRPPPPPTPALPGCCSPAEARGGWGGPWLTFTRPTTPRRLRTWPTASPAKGR